MRQILGFKGQVITIGIACFELVAELLIDVYFKVTDFSQRRRAVNVIDSDGDRFLVKQTRIAIIPNAENNVLVNSRLVIVRRPSESVANKRCTLRQIICFKSHVVVVRIVCLQLEQESFAFI